MIIDKEEKVTDALYVSLHLSKVETAVMSVALEGFYRQVQLVAKAKHMQGLVLGKGDQEVLGVAEIAHEMALLVDRRMGEIEKGRVIDVSPEPAPGPGVDGEVV